MSFSFMPPFSISVSSLGQRFAPITNSSLKSRPNLKGLHYSGNQIGNQKGCFPLNLTKSMVHTPYYDNLYSYFIKIHVKMHYKAELQIRECIEDNAKIISYFSTKTYVVTPH